MAPNETAQHLETCQRAEETAQNGEKLELIQNFGELRAGEAMGWEIGEGQPLQGEVAIARTTFAGETRSGDACDGAEER